MLLCVWCTRRLSLWRHAAGRRRRCFSSVGLVGVPNVGKSALHNALTKSQAAQSANFPFCTIEPYEAKVAVPDEQLQRVAEVAGSRRVVNRTMNFVDIAGLVQGAHEGKGLGNQFLENIRNVDAILHVVRCFDDDDIVHVENSVDPCRDLQIIRNELILADLQSVEKKLMSLAKKTRSGDAGAKSLEAGLQRCIAVLDGGYCLDRHRFGLAAPGDSEEDLDLQWSQVHSTLSMLSSKPEMVVMNVDEEAACDGNALSRRVQAIAGADLPCLTMCVQLEEAASGLGDAQQEFLSLAGVQQSSLDSIVQAADSLLKTQCFYTSGPQECRAWEIRQGSTAAEAAGKIHSDFQTNFVRAEVVSYDDFLHFSGLSGARRAGRSRQEGKSYLVQNRDIITFHSSKKF